MHRDATFSNLVPVHHTRRAPSTKHDTRHIHDQMYTSSLGTASTTALNEKHLGWWRLQILCEGVKRRNLILMDLECCDHSSTDLVSKTQESLTHRALCALGSSRRVLSSGSYTMRIHLFQEAVGFAWNQITPRMSLSAGKYLPTIITSTFAGPRP